MSKRQYIKKAIEKFVDENSVFYSDYSNWYIGITAKPGNRYARHGEPDTWNEWKADSTDDAKRIEKYFLDLGMNGRRGSGSGTYPRYVYVFKKFGPFS